MIRSASRALFEQLALTLGEAGAVPLPELVRALERAAERLRTRTAVEDTPVDLVSQSEAARAVGVSRQAVNQWVRNGVIHPHVDSAGGGRGGPKVSLAEVAVAANRNSREVPFSSARRRELHDFLEQIENTSAGPVASAIASALKEDAVTWTPEHIKVLGELVITSMGSGDEQTELSPEGIERLASLHPTIEVNLHTDFGRLATSLDLLVRCSDGSAGFDSPVTALLGLLGAATIGSQYSGDDTAVGRELAQAAESVWGTDWVASLFESAFHIGQLHASPVTRLTASLMYLDSNRVLRQAQATGVSVGYSRGPGSLLPQRYYGAPVLHDVLKGTRVKPEPWAFSAAAAEKGRPADLDSGVSPFRVMYFEYGLLDPEIHGIRRYCYSAVDAKRELRGFIAGLSESERSIYIDQAIATLARTLHQSSVELVAVDELAEFDWWKDHIIRSSPREVVVGLRDTTARKTAHALLVDTSFLPRVLEAADGDGQLRERLRIYVKNLEFSVIDARYKDDLRRGAMRVLKQGGISLSEAESMELARSEIQSML